MAGIFSLFFTNNSQREEEEKKRREEEEKKRGEAKMKLLIEQWDRVNYSPWWMHGIPDHATLVLDTCVLMNDTPRMSFWFKLLWDKAEEKAWKVVVLKSVYEEIVNLKRTSKKRQALVSLAKKRISRMQDQLVGRFRIYGKIKSCGRYEYADKGIIEYMLTEEGRHHILFTLDRELKIRLTQMSQNCGVNFPNEVRTCDNFLEHESYQYIVFHNEFMKSAYVVPDVEKYPPNAEFSLKKNGLREMQAVELRRFVEWSMIKLKIVD